MTPGAGDVREREEDRREAWIIGLLVATLVAVPLLMFAGALVPGFAIFGIPVAIGILVTRGLLVRGTLPPLRVELTLATLTGAIVAAFFAYFGERIAFLLLLLLVGAS